MSHKSAAKSLTAEEIAGQIIRSIDAEYHKAGDRAFAVLGAAYMDHILEQLLRAAFVDDQSATESLLGPQGPIGSNGARYNLAYAIGLIAKEERDDLKKIADIRNRFAHVYTAVDFESDDRIRDLVLGLHYTARRKTQQRGLAQQTTDKREAELIASLQPTPRQLFHGAVIDFLTLLLPRVREVRRASHRIWFPPADA